MTFWVVPKSKSCSIRMRCLLSLLCVVFIFFESHALYAKTSLKQSEKMPEKTLTLMLDWFVNPNHAAVIVAQQLGYFKNEGLKVNIEEPADPTLPAKLVAAHQIDLALFYEPNLISAVASGLPLMSVGTLIRGPLDGVIVKNNSHITTPADLKGKTIGISVPGYDEARLNVMLKKYNFDLKSIKLVNVGWNLVGALMSGQVDAITGGYRNFELVTLALHHQKSHMFDFEKYGTPTYDELILIANKKYYDRAKIKAFLIAIKKATTYIHQNPKKAWKIFISYNPKQLNNKTNENAWYATLPYLAKNPTFISKKDYGAYIHFMQQTGSLKNNKPLPVSSLIINNDGNNS